jgi:hypothetical protein
MGDRKRLAAAAALAFLGIAPASAARASGPSWSDADLGGAPASRIAAASDGQRRYVYWSDAQGHLWGVAQDVGAAFTAPFDTGVSIRGEPAPIVVAPDQVRVFFRGTNDHLSFVDGDGRTFGAVVDLGGAPLTSGPGAVVRENGKQAVFYRGPNGDLWWSYWDGGPWWSGAYDLGLAISAGPAAVVPWGKPDRLEVYAPDTNGKLGRATWDGQAWWLDLALNDVTLADGVGAASVRTGSTTVFYRQLGQLVRRSSDTGTFGAPEATGFAANGGPGSVSSDEAFYLANDGHLHRASFTPALVFPTYERVWGTATHNSYWINRNHWVDPFASGTQELISDQLLHEHVRGLELDVHTDDGNPGVWTIYHTDTPSNSLVHTLKDAVDVLRDFHYACPHHEVVNVVIELKNTNVKVYPPLATENTFTSDHTPDQFDQTFRDGLGDALYTPADMLARVAPGSTLARAAQVAGWPTIDELRGKFIINIIGNWSNAYHDWYRYAGETDIAKRVAFPLRSIFNDAGDGLASWPGNAHDSIPQAWIQPARDASVFWQVEDLMCPLVPDFLRKNGIVRGADSFDPAKQTDRLQRGFQLMQTDYPWSMIGDTAPAGAPTDPSRRFRDPAFVTGAAPIDPNALQEPGDRIYISTGTAPRFLYEKAMPGSIRWYETTVSTTRKGDTYGLSYPRKAQEGGIGGLRAAVSSGEYLEVLRIKTGHSGDGKKQEVLTVRVGVCHGGKYASTDQVASPYGPDAIGNMIALWVDSNPAGSIVSVFSAGRIDPTTGTPAWTFLKRERFQGSAVYQGVVATKDVLFAGSIWAEQGTGFGALGVSELPWITDQASVVDLSWPRSGAQPQIAPVP